MIANANRQIVLAARPEGAPKETDFRLVEAPVPEPADGELLVRTIWLSLDPYMRLRMGTDLRYYPPIPLGDVIVGGAVSRVVESRHPGFAARRHHRRLHRLAGLRHRARRERAQGGPGIGAALHRHRHPRHAGAHRLSRAGQGRPPRAGRYGRDLGSGGRGRRGRGPGGEDRGLPGGRHRRRGGEAALPHARARFDEAIDRHADDLPGALRRKPAPTASTSTSRTSAGPSAMRSIPCSPTAPAW